MSATRILQNQDGFHDDAYRRAVLPLRDIVDRSRLAGWIGRFRNGGFFAGLLLFVVAKRTDVVISVSHRPSLVFGLLCRLTMWRPKLHLATEFFFEDDLRGYRGMKGSFYRFGLRDVDVVLVNSTAEIPVYAKMLDLPDDRFVFVPWPSNITEPAYIEGHDESILAVGRSLRDWDTLFRGVEGLDRRVVVVAAKDDVASLRIPANVELHCDISRESYLSLLRVAKVVVLPLKPTQRSTGQASFLEAMSYGKPVLVSNVTGVLDYIQDGCNGLLCRPGDADDLRQKLMALDQDSILRATIAFRGYLSIIERFNKRQHAQAFLAIISGKLAARS